MRLHVISFTRFVFLYASRVERVRLAKSRRTCLFHARTFAPSASPRPPVHAESRLRVSHNARRGDGTEGHETHTPRARARARVLRGDVRAPPHAALTERQQQQSRGYVLGLILLILFLSSRDFSPPSRRRVEAAQGAREGLVRHREDVKDRLIVDLSASNERLELENRRLKVAAIGLAGSLRSLGRHEMADAYNLTGVGVFSGDDARLSSEPRAHGKASSADGDDPRDSADAAHVDEGMRLREAMKKVDGDETEGETETTRKKKKKASAARRAALRRGDGETRRSCRR